MSIASIVALVLCGINLFVLIPHMFIFLGGVNYWLRQTSRALAGLSYEPKPWYVRYGDWLVARGHRVKVRRVE